MNDYPKISIARGHYELPSGAHVDAKINLAEIYSDPRYLRHVAHDLTVKAQRYMCTDVAVMNEAVALATIIANRLADTSRLFIFAEHGRRFILPECVEDKLFGRRCLLVVNLNSSGKLLGRLVQAVRSAGGHPVVAAAIYSQLESGPEGLPLVTYVPAGSLPIHTDSQADCPQCQCGLKLDRIIDIGAVVRD